MIQEGDTDFFYAYFDERVRVVGKWRVFGKWREDAVRDFRSMYCMGGEL